MTTILCQTEACLNSRPLIPQDHVNDDIIEILTPGHFLIGRPLTALPDKSNCSCLFCVDGNSVKLSYVTSGKGGQLNT